MPEWTNGTVSNTVEVLWVSVGSNPTPSADWCFAVTGSNDTFTQFNIDRPESATHELVLAGEWLGI
jgi:hypothetical protein